MSSSWKPYFRDRLIQTKDDYVVIVPKDIVPATPLGCCICTKLYRSRDDEQTHVEFGCCHKCALRWAHPDRERWKGSWRPGSDDIKTDVASRPHIRVTIDLD